MSIALIVSYRLLENYVDYSWSRSKCYLQLINIAVYSLGPRVIHQIVVGSSMFVQLWYYNICNTLYWHSFTIWLICKRLINLNFISSFSDHLLSTSKLWYTSIFLNPAYFTTSNSMLKYIKYIFHNQHSCISY